MLQMTMEFNWLINKNIVNKIALVFVIVSNS